jgi:hypothetical protein
MRKHFLMDCSTVMDTVYDFEKSGYIPLLIQIRIWFHLLFCPDCSEEARNLQYLEKIMKTDFFPHSPDFENTIMERLYAEKYIARETDAPTGFSFRLWVIIGFFILLSLSSSFFGMNFVEIANSEGLSFLLPVGLTVGMVVTCYGALFIGSHLKELSSRFRLR